MKTVKRKPIQLPAAYMDTPERRVVTLEPDDVLCIPVLGYDAYRKTRTGSPPHVHPECLEISYCLRGDLEFESAGKLYPFRPGDVFVSVPDEIHHLRTWPKGLSKYWLLFHIPEAHFPLLRLPPKEARWLVGELTHLPKRLFAGGEEVRRNFQRLFSLYDSLPLGTPERTMRMRTAVADLLLSIVEAAKATQKVLPDVRIRRLAAEMQAHPEHEYPFAELAVRVGMSETSFLKRFKSSVGLPPHAYLVKCRIEKAMELLASGKGVGVVSDALGFANPRHFAKQFRAATGKSPRQWKTP